MGFEKQIWMVCTENKAMLIIDVDAYENESDWNLVLWT